MDKQQEEQTDVRMNEKSYNLRWFHHLTRGNFFAQIAYTYNDGGAEDNPTFLYSTGNRVVSARGATEALLQYNFDIPFLDTNFIVGLDYRNTTSDSEYTLYGNNENDSDYRIMGGYIQGTSSLSDKLKLTYALRRDKMNILVLKTQSD